MASRYWVGGASVWNTSTLNWSATSGGSSGASAPTASDDVFFDANSGTVNVSWTSGGAAVCRNLDTTGFTGQFITTGSNALVIHGGLTIGSTQTGAMGSGSASITFAATTNNGGSGWPITTNGKTLPALAFNGTGGSWIFTDNLTTSGIVSQSTGTLNLNSKTFVLNGFISSNSTARTLSFDSSDITITGTSFNLGNKSNLTATGTSTTNITMTGASNTFFDANSGTGSAWGNLSMTGTGTRTIAVGASTTFEDVSFIGASEDVSVVNLGSNLVCNNLTVTGANASNYRMGMGSPTQGATRTVTVTNAPTLANVDFEDITAVGTAWSGTSLGDCWGNSNITFTTPVNRYAVSQGNWATTMGWATTSGGSSGASVPLPQDDVFFDANSAAGTYTMNSIRHCRDLDCTGFTGTLSVSNTLIGRWIYGSLTLSSGMTWLNNGTLSLAGRGSHTLTNAGQSHSLGGNRYLNIGGFGGTYDLLDDLNIPHINSSQGLGLRNAVTFNSNNHILNISRLVMNNGSNQIANLGTSQVNILSVLAETVCDFSSIGTVLTGDYSINIAAASSVTRIFTGGNTRFNELNYTLPGSTGTLQINSSNYFKTLNFYDASNARTLAIQNNNTQTVQNFNVYGSSGKLISIKSVVSGAAAYIELLGPVGTRDYLSVKDIYSSIPYKFYAGVNSTNVSGNTNVIFTAPVLVPYLQEIVEDFGNARTANTVTLQSPVPAGQLIILVHNAISGNPGTVTPPTGFTLIDSTGTSAFMTSYYKISDGTETSFTTTNTGARNIALDVLVIAGFNGVPSLDNNVESAMTATNVTLTSTNTAQPAFALTLHGFIGTPNATLSNTNDFATYRPRTELTAFRTSMKPLTSVGVVENTYTWTTNRAGLHQLLVFKDSAPTSTGNFFLMF